MTDDRCPSTGDANRKEILSIAMSPVGVVLSSVAHADTNGRNTMRSSFKVLAAAAMAAAAAGIGVGVATQADASGWQAKATLLVGDGTEIGRVTFHGKKDATEV